MIGCEVILSLMTNTTLYERDFYAWTERTAKLLRAGRWDEIDRETVAEEIEDLGRKYRNELESRMQVLAMHLLKWRYQPDKQSASWRATIALQRAEIDHLISENPSLKPHLGVVLIRSYTDARRFASYETGLWIDDFPNACPWTIDELLDENFLPDSWVKE